MNDIWGHAQAGMGQAGRARLPVRAVDKLASVSNPLTSISVLFLGDSMIRTPEYTAIRRQPFRGLYNQECATQQRQQIKTQRFQLADVECKLPTRQHALHHFQLSGGRKGERAITNEKSVYGLVIRRIVDITFFPRKEIKGPFSSALFDFSPFLLF